MTDRWFDFSGSMVHELINNDINKSLEVYT